MSDYRLPIFKQLSIKHKVIVAAPLLEKLNISEYLDNTIEMVAASGESGFDARICNYDWILDIRRQCIEKMIPFNFHQTGAKLLKENKLYTIKSCYQISQARKAGIDYGTDSFKEL
jgi:protein gp37